MSFILYGVQAILKWQGSQKISFGVVLKTKNALF